VDPFAYVSHLSAMEWHGLTDRIPKILFISSPIPRDWRRFARKKMQKDLGSNEHYVSYLDSSLPRLRRLSLTKAAGKTVHRHASLHTGAFTSVKDRPLRVSTIGRTFRDMIREPDLCGGIYHVLNVYQQHAERYLPLIVDEIDRHGTQIEKVRAGYILEERLALSDEIFTRWGSFIQRGGSRKLYANSEYSPRFSEKWCLSLNIEE
jgi:predicted transcriptional regulator of viral defense system